MHKNYKKKNILEADIFKPTMRFKARTDLERVEETLKDTEGLNLNDKTFALNQINKPTTAHSDYSSSSDEERKSQKKFRFIITNDDRNKNKKKDIFDEEEERKKLLHKKIIESRKNMMKKRKFYITLGLNKRNENPNKAKFIRGDLHNKTHFKAMENLTMFKTSTMNHNIFRTWSKEDINQQKNLKEMKETFYSTITNGFKNKYLIQELYKIFFFSSYFFYFQ